MSDKKLADNVREAARVLAVAMNEAGEAGLHMTIELRSHYSEFFANGDQKFTNYHPIVSIWRKEHV